jgi:hypothetical protein
LLCCALAAIAGLALDFNSEPSGFWIGARPGGAAAIGAAAALFCFLANQIARLLLRRGDAKRSGDAGPHA